MSGQRVWIDKHPVLEPDEAFTSPSVTVSNNATDVIVTTLQIRWGKRCYLVGLGATVDAAGAGFITFSLQKFNVPWYPFHSATSQWGSVTQPMRMINAYQVEQGTILTIVGNMSTGGPATVSAAGRIMVEYEDF